MRDKTSTATVYEVFFDNRNQNRQNIDIDSYFQFHTFRSSIAVIECYFVQGGVDKILQSYRVTFYAISSLPRPVHSVYIYLKSVNCRSDRKHTSCTVDMPTASTPTIFSMFSSATVSKLGPPRHVYTPSLTKFSMFNSFANYKEILTLMCVNDVSTSFLNIQFIPFDVCT